MHLFSQSGILEGCESPVGVFNFNFCTAGAVMLAEEEEWGQIKKWGSQKGDAASPLEEAESAWPISRSHCMDILMDFILNLINF